MKWYIELPKGAFVLFDDLAMTFLNHFQLPVCYNVGIELLSTFRQDKATHISNHIQEWHRQKRLIKAFVPPKFILEWFLKLLMPYIVKDVSTYGVQNEEQAIFRAHELDFIYAQSGLLYEIILNAPRSSFDPKVKLGPHADGIFGCASAKPVDSVVKQVTQLSINQSASGQATASYRPTQTASVLSMQSSNQKGNQQHGRNRKKGKNNCKGGNRNENANTNDKECPKCWGGQAI